MTDDQMPARPAVVDAGARERPAEGTARGEAPGGALRAAIEAAQTALDSVSVWPRANGDRVMTEAAVRAAEPILSRAATAENDRVWCDIMHTATDRDDAQPFEEAVFLALKAERDGLRGKVEAVRALHVDYRRDGSECYSCESSWPCPTIKALDGGEG